MTLFLLYQTQPLAHTPPSTAAMRELYMKSGQGFLLVFSITSLSSLTELQELRDQIIRIKDDPLIPIVIVGNKSDLYDDRAVDRNRAFQVADSWNNAPYYETSARQRTYVDEAFVHLCRKMITKDVATGHVRDMENGVRSREQRPGGSGRGRGRGKPRKKKSWADRIGAGSCVIL